MFIWLWYSQMRDLMMASDFLSFPWLFPSLWASFSADHDHVHAAARMATKGEPLSQSLWLKFQNWLPLDWLRSRAPPGTNHSSRGTGIPDCEPGRGQGGQPFPNSIEEGQKKIIHQKKRKRCWAGKNNGCSLLTVIPMYTKKIWKYRDYRGIKILVYPAVV